MRGLGFTIFMVLYQSVRNCKARFHIHIDIKTALIFSPMYVVTAVVDVSPLFTQAAPTLDSISNFNETHTARFFGVSLALTPNAAVGVMLQVVPQRRSDVSVKNADWERMFSCAQMFKYVQLGCFCCFLPLATAVRSVTVLLCCLVLVLLYLVLYVLIGVHLPLNPLPPCDDRSVTSRHFHPPSDIEHTQRP